MTTKNKLYKQVSSDLKQSLVVAENEIKKLRQASGEETKSSMGDKYETSREMIRAEMDKQEMVLQNIQRNISLLEALMKKSPCPKIESGSLVETNKGNFWISISFGKIDLGGKEYFLISPQSPLAQVLLGKVKGDQIKFRESSYLISEVS